MYSLHLTGNPWFLLLLPPGLYILWRQYRGGRSASAPGAGRLIFALQAAALALLTASLTAPELRSHRVEFHNPAILILRDQSGSFRGGAYLGLGGRYADMEKLLIDRYSARKFDVRIVDFAERAWPVSGFPREGRQREDAGAGKGEGLTDLSALADFVDSAAVPNLQAAFLFSDGRSNLDSGRGSRAWKIPLYPVVFAPDSIAEIQPVQVVIRETGGRAGSDSKSPAMEVEASWRTVGRKGSAAEILILQGGKTLLNRKVPADAPAAAPTPEGEAAGFRIPWTPDRSAMDGQEPLRAVLRPAERAANIDPFNDTVEASVPRGRSVRTLYVLRPMRSLDEKGMVDILAADEGSRLAFFGMDDLAGITATDRDQIWVEASFLTAGGRLQAWLAKAPAKVVVYARPGRTGNLQVAGLEGAVWREFSPAAEIRPGKAASDAFPDEVVRLKGLSSGALEAPVSASLEAAAGEAWVEMIEGGHRAMLMGSFPLSEGKRAFFFCLPAIWGALFDPEADFATRENIAAYLLGARALADREERAVRVFLPGRVFQGVPFEVEAGLPRRQDPGKPAPGPLVFAAKGSGFSREWTLSSADGRNGRIKGVSLGSGVFRIELRAGAETLWRDSLRVEPWAALELGRIGFDMEGLDDAAARSGGKAVRVPRVSPDSAWVTSALPEPAAAQIRSENVKAIPLYNTLFQFLLVTLVLSLAWALRKKWDID